MEVIIANRTAARVVVAIIAVAAVAAAAAVLVIIVLVTASHCQAVTACAPHERGALAQRAGAVLQCARVALPLIDAYTQRCESRQGAIDVAVAMLFVGKCVLGHAILREAGVRRHITLGDIPSELQFPSI